MTTKPGPDQPMALGSTAPAPAGPLTTSPSSTAPETPTSQPTASLTQEESWALTAERGKSEPGADQRDGALAEGDTPDQAGHRRLGRPGAPGGLTVAVQMAMRTPRGEHQPARAGGPL